MNTHFWLFLFADPISIICRWLVLRIFFPQSGPLVTYFASIKDFNGNVFSHFCIFHKIIWGDYTLYLTFYWGIPSIVCGGLLFYLLVVSAWLYIVNCSVSQTIIFFIHLGSLAILAIWAGFMIWIQKFFFFRILGVIFSDLLLLMLCL